MHFEECTIKGVYESITTIINKYDKYNHIHNKYL